MKTKINQQPVAIRLGRWNIEQCEKKIHMKIDSSNEDHCGVCTNGNKSTREMNTEEKDEEYIRYFMV